MPQASTSEHDALAPGTRLGEFEIERVLGVGGFGIVYRALDHDLERHVAIKEYMPATLVVRGADGRVQLRSPGQADTFELGRRSFLNEARLLARFDHPSLVKVYRFWEANDTAYMVMPCYEGVTLREARRDMGHPPGEVWLRSLLGPLLGALDVLHRAQVYHRDIAPDNILLLGDVTGEGEALPVLLDFGAARHVIGDHTQSLTAIVKPSFAPIEQYAESAQLKQGPWTDIYALGAVVHYCLTGRPPMPATTRVVHDDLPALRVIGPAIERDFGRHYGANLLAAVDHALAVRPADRPPSVAAWRAEMNAPELQTAADVIDPTRIERTVFVSPGPGARPPDSSASDAQAYATTAPAAGPLRFSDAYARTIPQQPAAPRAGAAAPAAAPAPSGGPATGASEVLASNWARALRHPIGLGLLVLLVFAALVLTLKPPRRTAAPASAPAGLVAALPQSAVRPASDGSIEGDRRAATRVTEPVTERPARRLDAVSSKAAGPVAVDERPREVASGGTAAARARETSPAELCRGRFFLSRLFCMKRECAKPEFVRHPQCVRLRQQEEANRPRVP